MRVGCNICKFFKFVVCRVVFNYKFKKCYVFVYKVEDGIFMIRLLVNDKFYYSDVIGSVKVMYDCIIWVCFN